MLTATFVKGAQYMPEAKEAGRTCFQSAPVRIWYFYVLAGLIVLILSTPALADIWDIDPPLPGNDPQWVRVKTLWDNHYGGKNLDELISILTPLKNRYPEKIEPLMWLSRVHYLHARYHSRDRKDHFEKSEKFASQILVRDPENVLAMRYLVDTLIYSRDREYIFGKYGSAIKAIAPLPMGEALPDMKDSPRWGAFKKLWMERIDIEHAKAAMAVMETIARENPGSGLAWLWLSRGYCYIGEYYDSSGLYAAQGLAYYQKGVKAGRKALDLFPSSIPANYWYQLNLADSIAESSIMTMARNLSPLLTHLSFCSRENTTYYFLAPAQVLSGMIVLGGWVTEQGMRLGGITAAMDMNALEIGDILYPDHYAIAYNRANLLAYMNRKEEARAILERILAGNPDAVACIAPENHNVVRDTRKLYEQLKQDK
jgi:tetratricopeptide (TPR) repeat protein